MTRTGIEPMLQPWKGRVLTAWPTGRLVAGIGLEPMTYRVWTDCSSQLSYPAIYRTSATCSFYHITLVLSIPFLKFFSFFYYFFNAHTNYYSRGNPLLFRLSKKPLYRKIKEKMKKINEINIPIKKETQGKHRECLVFSCFFRSCTLSYLCMPTNARTKNIATFF